MWAVQVDQLDIAGLSDNQVRHWVVLLQLIADDPATHPGYARFQGAVASGLVGALRERQRMLVELDSDVLNAENVGGLVEEGTDPVADALEELRRPPYDDPFADGGGC
ncbi:hypothetical protein [Nocardioides sp. URHA0020]|uniref:hypothetical protein n=1 Tax=Nocardioides sp. URHA0020 TaxID=1380392 RepID=UPI00048B372A|nr:hypothetical protein [Nocardioides sp. URHA0020]